MICTAATAAFLLLASAGQTAATIAIPASRTASLRGADALFDQAKVVQVQEAIAVSDKTSDTLDMLLGEQCVALNKEIGDYYEKLLADYTDEEIIEWSCNSLQRKQSMKRAKAKEMDLGTQTDPCVEALEEIIAEADSEGDVDAELGDKAKCSEDVGFLLNALRDALDSPQLVEVGFLAALVIAAYGATSVATGAATAATTVNAAILVAAVVVPVVPPPP